MNRSSDNQCGTMYPDKRSPLKVFLLSLGGESSERDVFAIRYPSGQTVRGCTYAVVREAALLLQSLGSGAGA